MCDVLRCFYFDKTPKEFYKDMAYTSASDWMVFTIFSISGMDCNVTCNSKVTIKE